ncbi:hypothetical protein CMI47_10385 [Candidatus Pacearchaeota archaeon]|nr:hypothetical protein [Candidatus Pacearchaeota archaeon]|tara:strand:+ start:1250 stop:2626 length:1377 start_codon:yes stop_codon:yes gene_type:complete
MAKFLNKKEQVYDLKLTTYGHHLLAVGTFKPTYYAFFDDNVLYDATYGSDGAGSWATYTQVDDSPSDIDGYTLILTDAVANTHTLTFIDECPGECDKPTTSKIIYVWGQTTAQGIAEEVKRGINRAYVAGFINMKATRNGSIVTLRMTDKGIEGDGKTLGGTIFTGGEATKTPFANGSPIQYEGQNNVHKRIKEETSYFEGITLFKDIEDTLSLQEAAVGSWEQTITPATYIQRENIFKLDKMISDAWLDGDTQKAPAWKVVTLASTITSSQVWDNVFSSSIPQINIDLFYSLQTISPELLIDPTNVIDLEDTTGQFADGENIVLVRDNPLIYMEEVNTELLTKNFSIEVFVTGTFSEFGTILQRKYFEREIPQIANEMLLMDTPQENLPTTYTTNSVEYYFDVLTDMQVNQLDACKGAEIFNKQSYYVDLDFDCEEVPDVSYYDIYGSIVEPDICLD